jgi:hypothetical protein
MKENIITLLAGVLVVLIVGFIIYANVKCWNIPIVERQGICALLHQN